MIDFLERIRADYYTREDLNGAAFVFFDYTTFSAQVLRQKEKMIANYAKKHGYNAFFQSYDTGLRGVDLKPVY